MKTLLLVLRLLFPFFFASNLNAKPYSVKPVSAVDLMNLLQPKFVFAGANRFQPPMRTNGASRRKKTNRLTLSKLTRNKHR